MLGVYAGEFESACHYCAISCAAIEAVFGSTSIEWAQEQMKLAQLLFNRYTYCTYMY